MDTVMFAGDIGGTKVDLGLYSPREGADAPIAQAEFPSADYPGLGAIVREFLGDRKVRIDRACFAVAGPVHRPAGPGDQPALAPRRGRARERAAGADPCT